MGIFDRKQILSTQDSRQKTDWGGGQLDDCDHLRKRFFESYDRSLIEYMCSSRSIETHDRIHPIGEGRHFRALVLLPEVSSKIPLVISIPKSSFLGSDPVRNSARWCQDMSDLRKLRIPMIPPFELIQNSNVLRCLVTPFGSGGSDQANSRWQPVISCVKMAERVLAQHGFRIDDQIQVRCFEGIPFICDLSDLIRTKKIEAS
jgi:hypothetical protein